MLPRHIYIIKNSRHAFKLFYSINVYTIKFGDLFIICVLQKEILVAQHMQMLQYRSDASQGFT